MLTTLLVAAAVAAPVQKAADLYGKDVAGYVAWKADADMAMEGPFGTKASTWKAWVVAKDGQPVKTRLLALVADGKAASADEMAKLQARFDDPKAKGKNAIYWPFEPKHLDDYACTVAPGGYAFKARVRDAHHGDGSVTLGPDGRVKRVTYVPAVLPPRASSADVTIELAAVGPDWHQAVRSKTAFAGGIGPLKGGMTIDQRQAGHKRFKSLQEALDAAPAAE